MKVTKKQFNTRKCFICGMENERGVKAPFYEMEDKSVVSYVTFDELHQSYPGRVHGGIISAMLDEVAGRALVDVGAGGVGGHRFVKRQVFQAHALRKAAQSGWARD